jgi:hypothetical protein
MAPYLNWKSGAVRQEVQPHPEQPRRMLMRLELDEAGRAALAPLLREVYAEDGGELRLDLPREWVVFWKRREGESRLLLAHPAEDQWVATIALEANLGGKLAAALEALPGGESFRVGALGPLGSVSNLELEIGRS